jgi:hypothetical protein
MAKVKDTSCVHLMEANQNTQGNADGCEECLMMGSNWVQLRLCLACGHVGCCDSSINKHATNHPVIAEFPNKSWEWCYLDKLSI